MTETVVIAETVNGTVHPSTAELITAAQSLGSQPVVVVPCTDASAAEIAAGFVGSARVVAAKSSVFEHYDAAGWAAGWIPRRGELCARWLPHAICVPRRAVHSGGSCPAPYVAC